MRRIPMSDTLANDDKIQAPEPMSPLRAPRNTSVPKSSIDRAVLPRQATKAVDTHILAISSTPSFTLTPFPPSFATTFSSSVFASALPLPDAVALYP